MNVRLYAAEARRFMAETPIRLPRMCALQNIDSSLHYLEKDLFSQLIDVLEY
jgi:hypothetical protein